MEYLILTDEQLDEIYDLFDYSGSDWGDDEEGVFTFLLTGWDDAKELANILRKDERIVDKDLSDEEVIGKFGEYTFTDEYFKEWDGDGKIHPFYRNNIKAYANVNESIYSDKTILSDEYLKSDYIETLVNNPKQADTFLSEKDFTERGFIKLNGEEYENGYYDRQDDPVKIYNSIKEKDGDAKVVFKISYANPFATGFDVFVKSNKPIKESLSFDIKVSEALNESLTDADIDKVLTDYADVMEALS